MFGMPVYALVFYPFLIMTVVLYFNQFILSKSETDSVSKENLQ